MKTNLLSVWKPLLLVLVVLPLGAAKPVESPRLQVKIETPTLFDIMQEQDVIDALITQMDTAFRRAGFEGRIAELDLNDDARTDIPLLTLRLTHWERRVSGFVECRFTAKLTGSDGNAKDLGSFHGSGMSWGRTNRFTLSNAFEDAAQDALRTLYRDIAPIEAATADPAAAR
jgi:hypothetical protein